MTPELRAALRKALSVSALSDCGLDGDVDAIEPIVDAALLDYGHRMHEAGVLDERSEAFRQHRSATAKAALLAAADDLDNHAGQEDLSHLSDITDWLRARANEGNPRG